MRDLTIQRPEEYSLYETNFQFPGQQSLYRGKVRDVYYVDSTLMMVATDRISAFDHILPRAIPFKGQVLNQIALHFLEQTRDIVPNWLLASPDPNVSLGLNCDPIKIEMVIRAYLAGHAYRLYKSGMRTICGVDMPEGMREADPFPEPIITPATKADEGHDQDISKDEILLKNLVSQEQWDQLEVFTRSLFAMGSRIAKDMGLILVDTKYEFGMFEGKIFLIDEVHTPDSSRYYYLDGYEERQRSGEKQRQLSKEFVREWLMDHGFQGLEGQLMPEMPDSFVWQISERYIELFEMITGSEFIIPDERNIAERIEMNIRDFLKK